MAVTGTFTATGQSDSIRISRGHLTLKFTTNGDGVVAFEIRNKVNDWILVPGGSFTTDTGQTIDGGGALFRLNCTTFVSDIGFDISEDNTET